MSQQLNIHKAKLLRDRPAHPSRSPSPPTKSLAGEKLQIHLPRPSLTGDQDQSAPGYTTNSHTELQTGPAGHTHCSQCPEAFSSAEASLVHQQRLHPQVTIDMLDGHIITLRRDNSGSFHCPEPACPFLTTSTSLIRLHSESCASLGYHGEPGNLSDAFGPIPATQIEKASTSAVITEPAISPRLQAELDSLQILFNPAHGVLICQICGNCVAADPERLANHIRRSHPHLKDHLPFTPHLSRFLESAKLPAVFEKKRLPDWSGVISGLTVLIGNYCSACCTVLTSGEMTLRHTGCRDGSIKYQIPYQTWYRINGAASNRSWPVSLNSAGDGDQTIEIMSSQSSIDAMAAQVDAALAEYQNRQIKSETQPWDYSPFMSAMCWPSKLAIDQIAMKTLSNLALPAQTEHERHLVQLHEAYSTECVADCKKLFDTGSRQLQLLGSKDPENVKAWNWNLTAPTTRARYLAVWARLLCFLYRIHQAKRMGPERLMNLCKEIHLTARLDDSLSALADLLRTQSNPRDSKTGVQDHSGEDGALLLGEIYQAIITQDVFVDFYDSPLVHFVQALGIDANSGAFVSPDKISGPLASIQWCMRLYFQARFQSRLSTIRMDHGDRGSDQYHAAISAYRKDYEEARKQCLVSGCPGPFGYISLALAASISHARNANPQVRLSYLSDHTGLIYNGQTYLYSGIRDTLTELIVALRGMIPGLTGCPPDKLSMPPRSGFKDDLQNTRVDHHFGLDPQNNPRFLQRLPAITLTKLQSARSGKGGDSSLESMYEPYLRDFKQFASRLAVLLLMTCGMPPRGPELYSLTYKNTTQRRRGIFVVDGEVMLLFSYHKSVNVTGRPKNIARFPCPAAADLLMVYLLILRPVLATLAHARLKQHSQDPRQGALFAAHSPLLFPSFTTADEVFETGKDVTPVMKCVSVMNGLPPMGVGIWRHLSKAIGRVLLQERDKEQLMESLHSLVPGITLEDDMDNENETTAVVEVNLFQDLQHGHSTRTGAAVYGVSLNEVYTLSSEAVHVFRQLSALTNQFLGVANKNASDYSIYTQAVKPGGELLTSSQEVKPADTLDTDTQLALADLLQPLEVVPGVEQHWCTDTPVDRVASTQMDVTTVSTLTPMRLAKVEPEGELFEDSTKLLDMVQMPPGCSAVPIPTSQHKDLPSHPKRSLTPTATNYGHVSKKRMVKAEDEEMMIDAPRSNSPLTRTQGQLEMMDLEEELMRTPVLSAEERLEEAFHFSSVVVTRQESLKAISPEVTRILATLHGKDGLQFRYLSLAQRDAMSLVIGAPSRPAIQLIVLPTGGGKSDLYILPALMLRRQCVAKVIILVVPFTALLTETRIRCQKSGLHTKIWAEIQAQPNVLPNILVIGAEHSHGLAFGHLCKRLEDEERLYAIFFDECHTVFDGDWRHLLADFTHLHRLKVPIFLLSATVPVRRERELLKAFMCKSSPSGQPFCPHMAACSHSVFRTATQRPSVEYIVLSHPREMTILEFLRKILDRLRPSLGEHERILVYFNFITLLRDYMKLDPQNNLSYHRGPEGTMSERNLEMWRSGQWRDKMGTLKIEPSKVLLATSALGCGLDYPYIRHVIHIGEPNDLITVAQESGRGSRRQNTTSTHTVIYDATRPGHYGFKTFSESRDADSVLEYLKPTGADQCRRVHLSVELNGKPLSCFEIEDCMLCDLCQMQAGPPVGGGRLEGTSIPASLWPDMAFEPKRQASPVAYAKKSGRSDTPEQAKRFFEEGPMTPSSPSEHIGQAGFEFGFWPRPRAPITYHNNVSYGVLRTEGSESGRTTETTTDRTRSTIGLRQLTAPTLHLPSHPPSIQSHQTLRSNHSMQDPFQTPTRPVPRSEYRSLLSTVSNSRSNDSYSRGTITFEGEEDSLLTHPVLKEASRVAMYAAPLLDTLLGYCAPCIMLFSTLTEGKAWNAHGMHNASSKPCALAGYCNPQYSIFRNKLKYKGFSCCYQCRVPQRYCNTTEDNRFSRSRCHSKYQDIVLPVVWLFWHVGTTQGWSGQSGLSELWDSLPELHCSETELISFLVCHVTVNRSDVVRPLDKFLVNALWLVFLSISQVHAQSGYLECPSLL